MRKVVLSLLTLFALSCTKSEVIDSRDYTLDIALDIDSRVLFEEYKYEWEGGETVGFYTGSDVINRQSTVELRNGVGYCLLSMSSPAVGQTLYSYMPYDSQNNGKSASQVSLTFPSEQRVMAAGSYSGVQMPMVSSPYTITEDSQVALKFRPQGAVLCFNVYASGDYQSEKVRSVRYATTTPIAGTIAYNLATDSFVGNTSQAYSVTTSLDTPYVVGGTLQGSKPIYMITAPGNYTGTLTITTDVATYTYNYSRQAEINHYYNVNIDLSRAQYRKAHNATQTIHATLSYTECSGVIAGYKNPVKYTNQFGQWTICAYNEKGYKGIQLNSGKVSYVGTPTFEGGITSLQLTLSTSYADDIYICTEAGTTSAVGIVKSVAVDGKSVEIDLSDKSLKSLYIRSGACVRISSITVVSKGDEGTILPDPEPIPDNAERLPFTESFASGLGEFTIKDVKINNLSYVWHHSNHNGVYFMKASAFKDNTAIAAESWLISPLISLVGASSPKLTFEHTHKYAQNPSTDFTVWISTDNGDNWEKLSIPNYGTNTNWTFVSSGNISLAKYVGKSVKVAFKYISTTSAAGTWEIKNVVLSDGSGSVTPEPDPDPNPDPEPEPDPNPSTARYVWAELPVIDDIDRNGVHDSNSNIYYAHHLCAGGEKNAQRNGTARNYTVCYSGEHHCPLWVAAPRHKSYESGASRTDAYGTDPKIPSSVQYNSKSTGGGCNKGHMLGSAERLSSTATNKQVFYYTNIAPQYSSTFNTGGGAWNNLEDHVDGLVCSDTLYVVIGCYFKSFSKNGASASPKTISFGGRNDVSCPTMFYYALLRTKKGNTGKRVQDCSASELQCAAFTICHTMAKGHQPQAADMMSISDLEKLTGFKYFQNVPNAPKSSYSASDWL